MSKKEFIKEILKKLNQGMTFEEAKNELVKTIGSIESEELFQIEQEIINEGVSTDEIKRFCNVHALLFEGMFENKITDIDNTSHPINLFKAENREIEKRVDLIRKSLEEKNFVEVKKILEQLYQLKLHYDKKEQILFAYLEKKGFYGPSKVMWGKDNDIREMLKNAIDNFSESTQYIDKYLTPFLDEVISMVFKEENILFPTTIEKFSQKEWVEVFKQMANAGFVFITPPQEAFEVLDIEKKNVHLSFEDGYVKLPTGKLSLRELNFLLDSLPIDITFIDRDDKVKYFSNSNDRIFLRTPSIIGREVRNCHPPQSLDAVNKVIEDLKNGVKKSHDFWINMKGHLIYIRYFPVRDEFDNFLGILEVTEDVTEIKKLEGEKRLV